MVREALSKKDRMSFESVNKQGSKFKVIEYIKYDKVKIMFETGYIKESSWGKIKEGSVRDLLFKDVLKVGFIGDGKYKAKVNGKNLKSYQTWRDMLKRCYGGLEIYKSYEDISVCEEWHNYQNFAKWFEVNFYEIDEELHLDKDLLLKGSKIYSPESCLLVPKKINSVIINRKTKHEIFPTGVRFINNKYISRCQHNCVDKRIGSFESIEEAFLSYKIYKENILKDLAEKYKDKIPNKLYKALYNYQVEIDD